MPNDLYVGLTPALRSSDPSGMVSLRRGEDRTMVTGARTLEGPIPEVVGALKEAAEEAASIAVDTSRIAEQSWKALRGAVTPGTPVRPYLVSLPGADAYSSVRTARRVTTIDVESAVLDLAENRRLVVGNPMRREEWIEALENAISAYHPTERAEGDHLVAALGVALLAARIRPPVISSAAGTRISDVQRRLAGRGRRISGRGPDGIDWTREWRRPGGPFFS